MKHITPLDPDSPKGIALAAQLTRTLAAIQVEVWTADTAAEITATPAQPATETEHKRLKAA